MNTDEQIIEDLRRASEDLMMMSESDYPFEIISWDETKDITDDFLRRVAGRPSDAPVTVESMDSFFRPATAEHEGQGEEERRAAEKYRQLLRALETALRDVKVYKVGMINIPVYIVGRAPSGRWLGLSTRVIET
jgi:hypothetical protein